MYTSGAANDRLYQYTLSTPWDLSGASYDSVFLNVAGQDGTPQDITFKPDGTKMYMPGGNDFVYQYTVGTPWDLSTASYDSISLDANPPQTTILGMDFKTDGTKAYIAGLTTGSTFVTQYTVSTPWQLGTASYDSVFFTISEDNTPGGIRFKDDGTKMFISGGANNKVFQYTLGTPWVLSTASYDSISLDVGENVTVYGLAFRSNGTRLYTIDISGDTIYQYSS